MGSSIRSARTSVPFKITPIRLPANSMKSRSTPTTGLVPLDAATYLSASIA